MRKLFSTRKQLLQLLSCLILLFSCIKSFAQQNLVPNPSFEHFSVCPDNSVISIARDNKPDLWYKPDLRNAVYFNRCVHNQPIDGVPHNSFGGGGKLSRTKNRKCIYSNALL